jgi:hypothetical protein
MQPPCYYFAVSKFVALTSSLLTVPRELARYKLDLVRVQEVRWEGGGTEYAGEYTFFHGNGNENY